MLRTMSPIELVLAGIPTVDAHKIHEHLHPPIIVLNKGRDTRPAITMDPHKIHEHLPPPIIDLNKGRNTTSAIKCGSTMTIIDVMPSVLLKERFSTTTGVHKV